MQYSFHAIFQGCASRFKSHIAGLDMFVLRCRTPVAAEVPPWHWTTPGGPVRNETATWCNCDMVQLRPAGCTK